MASSTFLVPFRTLQDGCHDKASGNFRWRPKVTITVRDWLVPRRSKKIRTSCRQNPVWLRNQGSNEATEVLRNWRLVDVTSSSNWDRSQEVLLPYDWRTPKPPGRPRQSQSV
ncbi:hypothetical protein AB1N83_000119 [Pleurotus pulmonarius]